MTIYGKSLTVLSVAAVFFLAVRETRAQTPQIQGAVNGASACNAPTTANSLSDVMLAMAIPEHIRSETVRESSEMAADVLAVSGTQFHSLRL
jgi:hypothetical protein